MTQDKSTQKEFLCDYFVADTTGLSLYAGGSVCRRKAVCAGGYFPVLPSVLSPRVHFKLSCEYHEHLFSKDVTIIPIEEYEIKVYEHSLVQK